MNPKSTFDVASAVLIRGVLAPNSNIIRTALIETGWNIVSQVGTCGTTARAGAVQTSAKKNSIKTSISEEQILKCIQNKYQ